MSKHGLDARFHRRKWFPDITLPTGRYALTPTKHSLEKGQERGIDIESIDDVYVTEDMVYEIGVIAAPDGPEIVTMSARTYFTQTEDISYVFDVDSGRVITVYTNDVADTHHTLDMSQYDGPTTWQQLDP